MIISVDLEETCWASPWDRRGRPVEIIEIGAVKISLSNGRIEDEFREVVRPSFSKYISYYCSELTGLDNDEVMRAEYFWQVYPRFAKWCGTPAKHILSGWGHDDKSLRREIKRHGLEWKLPYTYIDASHLYRERYGGSRRGLSDAVWECNMEFHGRPHCAVDDARMAGKITAHLFGVKL